MQMIVVGLTRCVGIRLVGQTTHKWVLALRGPHHISMTLLNLVYSLLLLTQPGPPHLSLDKTLSSKVQGWLLLCSPWWPQCPAWGRVFICWVIEWRWGRMDCRVLKESRLSEWDRVQAGRRRKSTSAGTSRFHSVESMFTVTKIRMCFPPSLVVTWEIYFLVQWETACELCLWASPEPIIYWCPISQLGPWRPSKQAEAEGSRAHDCFPSQRPFFLARCAHPRMC